MPREAKLRRTMRSVCIDNSAKIAIVETPIKAIRETVGLNVGSYTECNFAGTKGL
jgi:hypothetical protein